MESVFVKCRQITLTAVEFENTDCSIVKRFGEWVVEVLSVDRETTTYLSHGYHEFGVISGSDEELWILSVSLQKIFLVSIWNTTGVGLGPFGFEPNTGPILGEIYVEEEGAELILPVIVAHHECTIIGIKVELLVWRQALDISHENIIVFLHFGTVSGPSSEPLRVTPRVSESQDFEWDLAGFVEWIREFHDIVDTVGVIQDESSGSAINNESTFFAVTFDTATHKAVIRFSLEQEIPETCFSTVVLLDHLVREESSLFVSYQDLLGLEACELLDTLIDVS
jgi:hypothetical protein